MNSSVGTPLYSQCSTQTSQIDSGFENCFHIFKTYILENHMSEVVRVLLEDEINIHYCLKIDGSDLLEKFVTLTEVIFFNAEKVLNVFDHAFHSATCHVNATHHLREHMTLKPFLHIRFKKLPNCSEIWRDRVPKSIDIGRFLVMEGTVIRTSSTKILEYKKEYMCTKCKNVFSLQADFQLHYSVPTPTSCPVNSECNGKKFVVMTSNDGTSGPKKCKDYQEIRVQEQVRKLSMGTIPRSLTVVLEDDLADCCKPGDDIIIFGSVLCRWHPSSIGKPCDLELVLKANNVEVCNERHSSAKGIEFEELQDEFQCFWAANTESSMMKARNHILASLCPQVYGLYVVKLAVALVLAGGVPRHDPSGSRIRGECHLLLVGDPGTGKSQFLKYAAKVTPRSVLTTGIGSSTAGLTVSAIRDGPHWTLEAGALVLADGGICCIDEFSGIKEHDRSAIHEAMEQQTISVAKAGLVCKLNTRTSILAATNPKLGKYDEASSVSFNIAIASPLLSRFDLVLVLVDEKNLHWDSVVADYLLLNDETDIQKKNSDLWSLDQMQAYFGIIRKIVPTLSIEADQVLRAYYRSHRQSSTRNAARTTIRLLESLIRLSEAHARLMFRNVVTIQDAIAAVTVVESSMQGCSLLPTGSILHSCFPNDADLEYQKHANLVLQCLGLKDLLPTGSKSQGTVKTAYSQSNQPTLKPAASKNSPNVQVLSNVSSTQLPFKTNLLKEHKTKASIYNENVSSTQVDFLVHKNEDFLLNNNLIDYDIATPNKSTPVNASEVKFKKHSLDNTSGVFISQNITPCNSKLKKANKSIFHLELSQSAFDFDLEITPSVTKKPKILKALGNNTPKEKNLVVTNPTKTKSDIYDSQSHSSYAHCKFSQTSPINSQISLFSVDALTTPKSQSSKTLPNCNKNAMSSTLYKSINSLFRREVHHPYKELFKLPDSETSDMFFSLSNEIFTPKNDKAINGSSSSVGNSNNNKNCSSITLDPSLIEDICGNFDICD